MFLAGAAGGGGGSPPHPGEAAAASASTISALLRMRTRLTLARLLADVSFAKKPPKTLDLTRARFRLPRFPPPTLLRLAVLAVAALVFSLWAIVQHYSKPFPPLVVPKTTPNAAPTYDLDAGEIPVPEIVAPEGD
jgi:hypothetical protein